ncbi:MAG: DNA polymerase IV [Lachnospiraceae bacterium]|nr:DNA polymerase IV [Lachnospiraceae bacterium]
MSKYILHVDVNSAFLSWTAVKELEDNPEAVDLRTIPSGIAGDANSRHGILTALSIPAKKCGIHTAENLGSALKKCPELVLRSADFRVYKAFSDQFINILKEFSPKVMQVSIDEAYVDITNSKALFENLGEAYSKYEFPINAAYYIKDTIKDRLKFTVNVGVSVNRILAKMASDFVKPDKVHTLFPSEIEEKMWKLDIGKLYGCGRQTADKLKLLGVNTIGQAAKMDEKLLKQILGEKQGEYIYNSANGIGSDKVVATERDPKSYSNEITLSFDITRENYDQFALKIISDISEEVAYRLRNDNATCNTVGVVVKTNNFKRKSKQISFDNPTNITKVISSHAKELMNELMLGENGVFKTSTGVRLIGVVCSGLNKNQERQLSIFDTLEDDFKKNASNKSLNSNKDNSKSIDYNYDSEKLEKLDAMLDLSRKKFGKGAIKRAGSLEILKRKDRKDYDGE